MRNTIVLLAFVFFISSCKGQGSLKEKLKTHKASSQKDCNKKAGYWYKGKCWASFNDEGITKENIDTEVEKQMIAINSAKVSINGNEHPISFFFPEKDEDQIVLITIFNDANESKSILQFIHEKSLKQEEPFKAITILLKGDIIELSEKGIDIGKLIENPDFSGELETNVTNMDKLNLNAKGNLKSTKTDEKINISFALNDHIMGAGNSLIEVKGNEAFLNGTLGTITYTQIKKLIKNHPEVKTLVLGNISGSLNDAVNMHTGRLVREAGLTTKVLKNSSISSGGVDLFCAGKERIVYQGAKIGVHSWSGGEFTAIELPKNHPAHQYQIEYFTMCFGEKTGSDFYFYTLEAAPFDGMHWMSDDEIKIWGVASKFIEDKPTLKNIENSRFPISKKQLIGKWQLKTVKLNGEKKKS